MQQNDDQQKRPKFSPFCSPTKIGIVGKKCLFKPIPYIVIAFLFNLIGIIKTKCLVADFGSVQTRRRLTNRHHLMSAINAKAYSYPTDRRLLVLPRINIKHIATAISTDNTPLPTLSMLLSRLAAVYLVLFICLQIIIACFLVNPPTCI